MIAPGPDQVPAWPMSWLPCWMTSATDGGAEFAGPAGSSPASAGAAATLKTARETAPALAWTTASSEWPTSFNSTAYWSEVAPLIGAQFHARTLQRTHW